MRKKREKGREGVWGNEERERAGRSADKVISAAVCMKPYSGNARDAKGFVLSLNLRQASLSTMRYFPRDDDSKVEALEAASSVVSTRILKQGG